LGVAICRYNATINNKASTEEEKAVARQKLKEVEKQRSALKSTPQKQVAAREPDNLEAIVQAVFQSPAFARNPQAQLKLLASVGKAKMQREDYNAALMIQERTIVQTAKIAFEKSEQRGNAFFEGMENIAAGLPNRAPTPRRQINCNKFLFATTKSHCPKPLISQPLLFCFAA
jgi:hypothetical protein